MAQPPGSGACKRGSLAAGASLDRRGPALQPASPAGL